MKHALFSRTFLDLENGKLWPLLMDDELRHCTNNCFSCPQKSSSTLGWNPRMWAEFLHSRYSDTDVLSFFPVSRGFRLCHLHIPSVKPREAYSRCSEMMADGMNERGCCTRQQSVLRAFYYCPSRCIPQPSLAYSVLYRWYHGVPMASVGFGQWKH